MNIYFSGIGGVGIGPLAEIAHDAGYGVVGSDSHESLTTVELRQKGIIISNNQDGTFLRSEHSKNNFDWFIYTAALPFDHPELVAARELGLHIAKRDELLAHIIKEKNLKLIAIAGTHGKTTTTSMLVWTLQQLGVPISYSIGTTLKFGPSGKFDAKSEYFIYECDEFDRNFLHFYPYLSLITSIDYDHSDIYKNSEDYLAAFHQFALQSQKVIAWNDENSQIYDNLDNTCLLDPSIIDKSLKLNGAQNRRNATLVLKGLNTIGFDSDLVKILNDFPGADRRFEKLAENLYSDYGHHPVEIAATLEMAREISDHVVLVYQPHQNIRQHEIRDQYTDKFELAEKIYWLPTYLSREDPNLPILKPEQLIDKITNKDHIVVVKFDNQLWQNIMKDISNGKLVLCMGAGQIDSWVRERLQATEEL